MARSSALDHRRLTIPISLLFFQFGYGDDGSILERGSPAALG